MAAVGEFAGVGLGALGTGTRTSGGAPLAARGRRLAITSVALGVLVGELSAALESTRGPLES